MRGIGRLNENGNEAIGQGIQHLKLTEDMI